MEALYHKPMEIESRSMAIIEENLTGVEIPEPERSILKRVIHTTADFDYVENLCFSRNAVSSAKKGLQNGAHSVTEPNMALSGINKRSLHQLGCQAHCFMSDPDVAAAAKARGVTRAMVSMEKACSLDGDLIFAVGNAPTALIQLDELIRAGKLLPKLIIGVPVGFVNADPKIYENTEIISKLSYKEAIELSNCGAKVIHPKTIKPLQNKGIPLFVRSFLYPESHGSVIRELDEKLKLPPIYINKGDQLLLTLSPRDFSFIAEEKLSRIFATLAKYRLRLNLMQNSAITFSFCIDYNEAIFESFIDELHDEYEVLYNKNVRLLTIRHYNEDIIQQLTSHKNVLVEQRSRLTARFVVADN